MSSDFFFAEPSYISGLARLFDFAGALNEYNNSSSPEEADALAIAMDWAAIREDYHEAVEAVIAAHPELGNARP